MCSGCQKRWNRCSPGIRRRHGRDSSLDSVKYIDAVLRSHRPKGMLWSEACLCETVVLPSSFDQKMTIGDPAEASAGPTASACLLEGHAHLVAKSPESQPQSFGVPAATMENSHGHPAEIFCRHGEPIRRGEHVFGISDDHSALPAKTRSHVSVPVKLSCTPVMHIYCHQVTLRADLVQQNCDPPYPAADFLAGPHCAASLRQPENQYKHPPGAVHVALDTTVGQRTISTIQPFPNGSWN